jgi:hypothetical protein
MTKRHVIEILYAERCRLLPLAVQRVRQALSLRDDPRLDVEVRLVLVDSFVEAVARRFHGSPTVRIDDQDVAPDVASIRRALDALAAEEGVRRRLAYTRASAPGPKLAEGSV